MRKILFGVPVLFALVVLSLAARPQGQETRRVAIKYGDRMSEWIGKHFNIHPDRSVAIQWGEGSADLTLVAIGVDYFEFKSKQGLLLMVPMAGLRFEVGQPN